MTPIGDKLINMEQNEMFQNNDRKSSVGEGASSPKVEPADIKIDDIEKTPIAKTASINESK